MPKSKRCCHCRETKPLSAFDKNKARSDGFQSYCKVCRNELNRDYFKRRNRDLEGLKLSQGRRNITGDFTGNYENFIYMDICREDAISGSFKTEHVCKAKALADVSGNPVTWRRGDPVEGLPEGIRKRIEKALTSRQ